VSTILNFKSNSFHSCVVSPLCCSLLIYLEALPLAEATSFLPVSRHARSTESHLKDLLVRLDFNGYYASQM
jgi:hypothetical protein